MVIFNICSPMTRKNRGECFYIYLSIDTLFDANGDVSPLFLPCSSYRPRIKPTSLTYCFRIVSASGSENDRRTIGERYGIDTVALRQCGCLVGILVGEILIQFCRRVFSIFHQSIMRYCESIGRHTGNYPPVIQSSWYHRTDGILFIPHTGMMTTSIAG